MKTACGVAELALISDFRCGMHDTLVGLAWRPISCERDFMFANMYSEIRCTPQAFPTFYSRQCIRPNTLCLSL